MYNPRFNAMVKARVDKAQAAATTASLITPLTAAQAQATSVQAYQNSGKASVAAATAGIRLTDRFGR
jgi:hypothetical protein